MPALSPSGQSQINPFQLPRGEQIETPIELVARLGAGALNQMGQDRKKEQQVNSILNVLFPQGQAAAQAGAGGANPADVGVVPGAATPGSNPSAPQGIGQQIFGSREQAQAILGDNPDLAQSILQAVIGKRLEGPDQAKLQPVPGVPGAFFDPNNPSNVIFNDDLFNRAQDLKRAGASNTNVSVGGTKVETEFDKELGKQLAKTREGILTDARQAKTEKLGLQAVRSLLGRAEVGPLSATKAQAQIIANRFGLDVGDIDEANATAALQSVLARSALDDLARFPGQISEGERRFVLELNPNVAMTRPQIETLLSIKEKMVAERFRALDFMRQWQQSIGLKSKNEAGLYFDTAFAMEFGQEPSEALKDDVPGIDGLVPDSVATEGVPVALPTQQGANGSEIDVSKLSEGQLYRHPQYGVLRWDGEGWETVE
ncbi:hypothetical protein [Limibacillus sp. MBR-115]|jgi:hypothetical protein|uniref:hypothetical protein n=1 Tax=Limibacillus sp. MBR-115 TaxID=3156465 RepID=UPI003390FAAC